jgi:DNA-binding GntR family transcriptional regulator
VTTLLRSPMPLYFQMASDLEQQILAGTLPRGAQLQNEKRLAQHYGVSLVTVRSAMQVLFNKGLIVRYPGRGTFVAKRERVKQEWAIGSLDELVAIGLKSSMHLLARRQVYPSDSVLERLNLPPNSMVHMVRTQRKASGEPFMITEQYHPPDLARALRKTDFTGPEASSRLVIQILAERCGMKIESVRQTMSAESAGPDIAGLLGLREGDPLLVVERDYFNDQGRLVQTGKSHYRTDRYRYVMNISQVEQPVTARNVYRLPLRRGGALTA